MSNLKNLLKLSLVWALGTPVYAGVSNELHYLAEAIYFEARSEPLVCQIIVAQSIITRVNQDRYPDTIQEVVHQRKWSKKEKKLVCQYSYFCDGKSDIMTNIHAELKSYQVASMVLLGQVPEFSEGADHYYAHNITTPEWEPYLESRFICNNHTFGILKW